MLFLFNFWDNLVTLVLYIVIYNFSLILLFWTVKQTITTNLITINSLSLFKHNHFFVFLLTVLFLSMAGVPPFLGFFAKILILVSLVNLNFFTMYFFFFILLFFSLYFYVQNIRFLQSTQQSQISYSFFLNLRLTLNFFYFAYFTVFFLLFGFIFFDDFLLIVYYWFV